MPTSTNAIEKRLWSAADELRANSRMRAADYSIPVLGLIFLRYADFKFSQAEKELETPRVETPRVETPRRGVSTEGNVPITRRRSISKIDYQARGVMYLPAAARWSALMN